MFKPKVPAPATRGVGRSWGRPRASGPSLLFVRGAARLSWPLPPAQALEYLREAWPSRIELPADGNASVVASAARLGLPDPALAALPAEALRPLAPARTSAMPDLVHLNSPGLQHLRLQFPQLPAAQLRELRGMAVVGAGPEAAGAAGAGFPGQQLAAMLASVLQVRGC